MKRNNFASSNGMNEQAITEEVSEELNCSSEDETQKSIAKSMSPKNR